MKGVCVKIPFLVVFVSELQQLEIRRVKKGKVSSQISGGILFFDFLPGLRLNEKSVLLSSLELKTTTRGPNQIGKEAKTLFYLLALTTL